MKLEELDDIKRALSTDHGSYHGLKDFLLANNFDKIGTGLYADVYGNSSSVVIKIGRSGRRDGFVKFIDYVRAHSDDPNLPKIGTPRWFLYHQFEYYVVPMIKLTPLAPEYKPLIWALREIQLDAPLAQLQKSLLDIAYKKDINTAYVRPLLKYPHLQSLCASIIPLHRDKGILDLHSGNYMMRGSRIIITDPWAINVS